MNKFKAVVYGLILILALVSRFFECLFEAVLQAGLSPSFFVESFRFHWNDQRYYTPVSVHWERLKELWNET